MRWENKTIRIREERYAQKLRLQELHKAMGVTVKYTTADNLSKEELGLAAHHEPSIETGKEDVKQSYKKKNQSK